MAWFCVVEACNYLLVYEYVITADVGSDMWAGIKRIAATQQGKAHRYLHNHKLLMLDLSLCVVTIAVMSVTGA